MRNSLLPLIAAIAIFALGAVLIRPTVSRGQGGPEVNAGILRLPKRDPLRTDSAALAGTTAATIKRGARDDGLWRVVVVAGDDRSPVTGAAMLALGEQLFLAGMIAVMDPLLAASEPTPPLPLPADRVVRITTREAAIGETAAAPWSATVVFSISEPRLPAGHPGEGLLPPPQLMSTIVEVSHEGHPASAATTDWPTRWAATGRTIVDSMLSTALPPSGLHRPDNHLAVDWGSALFFPPTTPELRWSGCFQHDLVRGWTGRIDGRTVKDSKGRTEAAIQPLLRLLPRGGWEPVSGSPAWSQWSRLRDGQRQWFATSDLGDGWACTMWTERPDAGTLIDGWITSATTGDTQARDRLRRLLSSPGLGEGHRVRIEQALR